jgi:hypothetical protein
MHDVAGSALARHIAAVPLIKNSARIYRLRTGGGAEPSDQAGGVEHLGGVSGGAIC